MTATDQPAESVFDIANLLDPYPMYKRLRDEAPVYPVPELNMHYVTRYDLVREVLKDTETYSSRFDEFMAMSRQAGLAGQPDEIRERLREMESRLIPAPPTMLTLDEPEHTRYRSLVGKLFTGGEIKRSEPQVLELIEQKATRFIEQGETEFMSGFACPVPLEIIAIRLGIPVPDRALFYDCATAAAAGLRMSPATPEELLRRAELALHLQELLVRLIEQRRLEPRRDMLSILATSRLEDEDRNLTHGEALSILQQFLVAGHETTASAFGWGLLALCRKPALQEELRGNAEKIRVFVEESLRLEAPVQGLPRRVTRDTELGGRKLAAGSFVMLRFGAANRDERQFPEPDEVNIQRSKAGMQLAFGSGIHFCIGAPLARQELNLGFRVLLDRMRNIRLAAGREVPPAEPSFILRNLPQLHIEFA